MGNQASRENEEYEDIKIERRSTISGPSTSPYSSPPTYRVHSNSAAPLPSSSSIRPPAFPSSSTINTTTTTTPPPVTVSASSPTTYSTASTSPSRTENILDEKEKKKERKKEKQLTKTLRKEERDRRKQIEAQKTAEKKEKAETLKRGIPITYDRAELKRGTTSHELTTSKHDKHRIESSFPPPKPASVFSGNKRHTMRLEGKYTDLPDKYDTFKRDAPIKRVDSVMNEADMLPSGPSINAGMNLPTSPLEPHPSLAGLIISPLGRNKPVQDDWNSYNLTEEQRVQSLRAAVKRVSVRLSINFFKGASLSRQVNKKIARETTAAITIQARFRGYYARKQYKLLKIKTTVVREMLITELDYVRFLSVLSKVYYQPLKKRAQTNKPIATIDEVKIIFPQVEVITTYNSKLADMIQRKLRNWSVDQTIGDVFIAIIDFLRDPYTTYIAKFPEITKQIDICSKRPDFAYFLEQSRKFTECASMDLLSLASMPFQRIPRYTLLLKEALKNTTKNHRDYEYIRIAIKKLQQLTSAANNRIREDENIKMIAKVNKLFDPPVLNLVNAHRKLLRDGSMPSRHFSSSSDDSNGVTKPLRNRRIILFSDCILLAKPCKRTLFDTLSNNSDVKLKPLRIIELRGSVLADVDPSDSKFKLRCKSGVVVFNALNWPEKEAWMDDIATAIKSMNIVPSSLSPVLNGRPSYGMMRAQSSMMLVGGGSSSSSGSSGSGGSSGGNISSETPRLQKTLSILSIRRSVSEVQKAAKLPTITKGKGSEHNNNNNNNNNTKQSTLTQSALIRIEAILCRTVSHDSFFAEEDEEDEEKTVISNNNNQLVKRSASTSSFSVDPKCLEMWMESRKASSTL